MTKKQAKHISELINGLMTWSSIASRNIEDKETFENATKWYNENADELIAMGINVNKYI